MNGESPLDRFQRWYRLLPPALRFLLTVNTVIYLVWFFVRLSQAAAGFVVEYLALTPAPTALFRPWTLLTYSVVHLQVGLWGLIAFGFNMLWLYWMGRDYEETYGSHRLFGLYVLAAVGGGVRCALLRGHAQPEPRHRAVPARGGAAEVARGWLPRALDPLHPRPSGAADDVPRRLGRRVPLRAGAATGHRPRRV